MPKHDEKSRELMKLLREQTDNELALQQYPLDQGYGEIYGEITNYLIDLVKRKKILSYRPLQLFMDSLVRRLEFGSPSSRPIRSVLIQSNGFVNASSLGEGTIILNIGLIASARNADDIAFILAHEMAHYRLNHFRERIEDERTRAEMKSVFKRLNKVASGRFSLEDLEAVQSYFNIFYYQSRENELEADNYGMEIFLNAGFSADAATEALRNLKYAYIPPYPLKRSLFDYFLFEELPFQKRWLAKSKARSRSGLLEAIINNDSASTHPNIDERIATISNYQASSNATSPVPEFIQKDSKLESVNAFYHANQYDFGIHTALQLKAVYPTSSYLDFEISRMLYGISLAKNDKALHYYVSRNIDKHPPETRALNHFFYNLTFPEAAELSFLFCKRYFDKENPDHYRVLFKILNLTNRTSEAKKLKKEFRLKFPKEDLQIFSDEK